MFCRQCGVRNEEGSRFCESCGTRMAVTGGGISSNEFDRGRKNRSYDDTVLMFEDERISDSYENIQDGYHYELDESLQGRYHYDLDENLQGRYHYDSDGDFNNHGEFQGETYRGGTYRDHGSHRDYRDDNAKKKRFAFLVFIASVCVIAIGFGLVFFLGGDRFTTNDVESSDVTEVESGSDLGLDSTTEEAADDPEPAVEEADEIPAVEDVIDVDAMPIEERMTLVGTWEGSFLSRGGIAYDLIIGIDSNYRVTATYFGVESRTTILARYYGVAHRRGNNEVIIEYTSSSIRPAGWDESGITLIGTMVDNTISGFFEFEGNQTGTAFLRMDDLPNAVDEGGLYRIRITWEDAASQIGAFADLSNAINATPEGYSVFDGQGNVVFTR